VLLIVMDEQYGLVFLLLQGIKQRIDVINSLSDRKVNPESRRENEIVYRFISDDIYFGMALREE
jgi:hypothetical protein